MYNTMVANSSTLAIRIPRETMEKMKKLDVRWSEEVRAFVEETIRRHELLRTLEEIGFRADRRRASVDSTQLIREDRER